MTGQELVHVPGKGRTFPPPGNPRAGPGRPNARRRLEIEQRRARVSALYLAKRSGRQIAKDLGIPYGTIKDDFRAIRKGWRDRYGADFQGRVDEEEAKLDGMERVLIPKAFLGDLNAVAALLRLMDRRAKLLGLDVPVRAEVKVEHIDLEAKKERGRALLDELAPRREARAAEG